MNAPRTRVLITDDSPRAIEGIKQDVIELSREMWGSSDPLSIETRRSARDAAEEIRKCKDSPWDVVLADVFMPEAGDGAFAIADAVHDRWIAAGERPPLKLAAITNKATLPTIREALARWDRPENASWFLLLGKGRRVATAARGQEGGTGVSDFDWLRALLTLLRLQEAERWGHMGELRWLSGAALALSLDLDRWLNSGEEPPWTLAVQAEEREERRLIARHVHDRRARARGWPAGDDRFYEVHVDKPDEIPEALCPVTLGNEEMTAGLLGRAGPGTVFVDAANGIAIPHAWLRGEVQLVLGIDPRKPAVGGLGGPAAVNLASLSERAEDMAPCAEFLLRSLNSRLKLDTAVLQLLAQHPCDFRTLSEVLTALSRFVEETNANVSPGAAGFIFAASAGAERTRKLLELAKGEGNEIADIDLFRAWERARLAGEPLFAVPPRGRTDGEERERMLDALAKTDGNLSKAAILRWGDHPGSRGKFIDILHADPVLDAEVRSRWERRGRT